MPTASYSATKTRLQDYFDRTAVEAWARLTSDAPVSRIRATVRAGRDAMRGTLLSWLPRDLSGLRVYDAGCGAGQLAIDAARRGAAVTAVDVAATLVALAKERAAADGVAVQDGGFGEAGARGVDFRAGDMLDPLGHGAGTDGFDHVVAMDSLIHYRAEDMVAALGVLTAQARSSVVFTFAPWTPALGAMRLAGRAFPRADRAPAIIPVPERKLRRLIRGAEGLAGWRIGRTRRVAQGFYVSQALELVRQGAPR